MLTVVTDPVMMRAIATPLHRELPLKTVAIFWTVKNKEGAFGQTLTTVGSTGNVWMILAFTTYVMVTSSMISPTMDVTFLN